MKTVLFALLVALSAASALAAEERVAVRAEFGDPSLARHVAGQFGHARIDWGKRVMQVETDAAGIQRLRAAGFRVEVDSAESARLRQSARMLAEQQAKSIGGFTCYRSVEETFDSLKSLIAQYPGLISVADIGQSWQQRNRGAGYPIKAVKLTNSQISGTKPKLFLMSSMHAREYTPAELATRFVERLLAGYGTDADATWLIDHHEIHAVLQANPDGRKKAEAGLLWRKNTNDQLCAASGYGVDLNRNYPFEWGLHGGSSPDPCSETYRGNLPASEPEAQAVVAYLRAQQPDMRGPLLTDAAPAQTPGLFIDIHSFAQLVLWPWGFTETPAPNGNALATLGRRLAWFNGYTAEQSVGLYPTDGTAEEFAYGDLGMAAFTLELGTAFFEACGSFEQLTLEPNLAALKYAARVSRAPYQLPSGPDAQSVAASADLLLPDQAFIVTAKLSDARFQQRVTLHSGPAAAVDQVVAANLYIDIPPWQAGAVPIPMSASDGAFDGAEEWVEANVAQGLSVGRHMVFVQGRDSSAALGPVSAGFVEVVAADQALSLQGRITEVGSGTPLQATLKANRFTTTSSAVDGRYQRVLPGGDFTLEVTADEHESIRVDAVSLFAGSSVQRDFELYRRCARLDDPVDLGDVNFSAQSPWTLRPDLGNGGTAWVPASGALYPNSLNVSLTSTALDLRGDESLSLRFDSRCDTEAGFDFGQVEISLNGGAWSEVFRCNGDPQWRTIHLPLPTFSNQADARLRFRFTSDSSVAKQGWAVDNIRLSSGGARCRAEQLQSFRIFGGGFEAD